MFFIIFISYWIDWEDFMDLEEHLDKLTNNTSRLSNIDYQTDESCKLQRQIIRRLEHIGHQQELTNNILIEMARADSREDLNNRLDMLLAM